MCGIGGVIDTIEGSVSHGLLVAMGDAMSHRGPDGAGYFEDGPVGMTMRRLSIIDLEGGWQPFFARRSRIVAFQNGEIYNYRELRPQLESRGCLFSSKSDTEVLAHGFAEWGAEGLLSRLDGMYAIAILDRDAGELHLARDRFGEKPLFYTSARGRFAYSSNLLALAALGWVDHEIDLTSLDQYLALHYVPGESTIFKTIKRVLPGERLVVRVADPVPLRSRYYVPALGARRRVSDEELASRIESSIESRLVADVPVGVFLSGGLDSSLVAAVAARKQPEIATFSMGFAASSHDESPYARLVAERIGSRHHHFIFDEKSFRTLLPEVIAALDEPVGDQAMLPLFWLCREARQHVTVALSGEGADEVFAGYSYYNDHLSKERWSDRLKRRFGAASSRNNQLQRLIQNNPPVTPSGFPLLTSIEGRERLLDSSPAVCDWEASLIDWLNTARDPLQRAAATDIATWLPDDLLVKFDRMSMAHSLEGRAPYLNARIVEPGLQLPETEKLDGEVSKISLRRVAARWLPREILERPKRGFVLPMARWLEQWFANQPSLDEYLTQRSVPGLNMAEIADLVKTDIAAGVQRERLLFALVALVEWHVYFKSRKADLSRRYSKASSTQVTRV